MPDLHSDSLNSVNRNTPSNLRRLSSSTTLTKLRSVTNNAKCSVSGVNMTPLVSTNLFSPIRNGDENLNDNQTIPEGTEDDLSLNAQFRTTTFAELVRNLRKSSTANISKLNLTKNNTIKMASIKVNDIIKENENKIKVSPSNPGLKNYQPVTSIGMFQSIKRHKLCNIKNEENMSENNLYHRRTKSLTRK